MLTPQRKELLEAALIGLRVQAGKLQEQMADITAELMGRVQRSTTLIEVPKRKIRKLSAEGKARIAAATKKRWRAWRKAQKAA